MSNNNRVNRSSSGGQRNTPNPTSNRGTKLSDGVTENTDWQKDLKNVPNNIYKMGKKKYGVDKIFGGWVFYLIVLVALLTVSLPVIESMLSIAEHFKKEPIKTEIIAQVDEGNIPIIINSLIRELQEEKIKNGELNKEKDELKKFYEDKIKEKDLEIENLNSLQDKDT